MKPEKLIFALFLGVFLGNAVMAARPAEGQTVKPDPKVAKAKASPALVTKTPRQGADPDKAYKANCSRCHAEPRRFKDKEMVTVMRHMRVRANLTADEAAAILRYLTK